MRGYLFTVFKMERETKSAIDFGHPDRRERLLPRIRRRQGCFGGQVHTDKHGFPERPSD
jgi:hypothetical protein